MSGVKSWRTVVRLKERRLEQQGEAVQKARTAVDECEAELATARELQDRCREAHAEAREVLRSLLRGETAFKPEIVILRRDQIAERESSLKQAEHGVQTHETRVQAMKDEWRAAIRLQQRMTQQLELAREALAKAELARDQAQEDQQDEDAEETAVARMLAATRASAAEHGRSRAGRP